MCPNKMTVDLVRIDEEMYEEWLGMLFDQIQERKTERFEGILVFLCYFCHVSATFTYVGVTLYHFVQFVVTSVLFTPWPFESSTRHIS